MGNPGPEGAVGNYFYFSCLRANKDVFVLFKTTIIFRKTWSTRSTRRKRYARSNRKQRAARSTWFASKLTAKNVTIVDQVPVYNLKTKQNFFIMTKQCLLTLIDLQEKTLFSEKPISIACTKSISLYLLCSLTASPFKLKIFGIMIFFFFFKL